jgi:CheY-like chemotaxis protein
VPGELILIVEDNENNRLLVRDVLQAQGYQTMETDTAEEGIQLAVSARPALILMDIQLPRMNGIEALRHLREDPLTRDIPVIAITASAMMQDRQMIMAAGFDNYQTKPISVREFLDAVRATLDRRTPSADAR